ncbi:MAG: IclR family transcriptional regulator [Suipraeoptans sp.]
MIQSLDRGMLILSILERQGSASVTEIAEELGVNKSTVSRLIETLKSHDMVQVDTATKKYRLGFKILYLGEGVKRNINVIAIARPFLSKLFEELNESVHLCAFNNDAAYVVDQVHSNKVYNLAANVGMIEPLHSSSVGKCILAFSPPSKVDRLLKDYSLTAYTPKTITNINDLRKNLAVIRNQGYAIDNEEMTLGVRCIAAPVYNYRGRVNYCLGVSGTTTNIKPSTIERYISALVSISNQISLSLGYKPSR